MRENKNNRIKSNNSSIAEESGIKKPGLAQGCIIWLSLAATLVLAGAAASAQTPDPAAANEIVVLLERHDQALNQKDMNAVMALYAPGATTVLIGTGPGERWVGKDEIRDAYQHFFQDFDRGTLVRECFWRTGEIRGDTAWAAAMCKMTDSMRQRKREYGLNVSAIFVREGDAWMIRSMHFSNLTGGAAAQAASSSRRRR